MSRGSQSGTPDVKAFVLNLAATVLGTVTAVGVLAFIGGALTWLRFEESGLPASEAISVTPNARLVATGMGALVVFLGAGVLVAAVVLVIPWDEWERALDPSKDQLTAWRRRLHGLRKAELRSFGTASLVFGMGVMAAVTWVAVSLHAGAAKFVLLEVVAALGAVGVLLIFALARTRGKNEPRHFRLGWLDLLAVVLGAAAAAVLWLSTRRWDLVYVLLAAAVAALIAYGIGETARRERHTESFWPVALGLLLAILLYSVVWRAAEYGRSPHVAPIALIRDGKVGGRAVHQIITGIYVASSDKRIWIAGIGLDCVSKHEKNADSPAIDRTGHLVSIPIADVREYEIGDVGTFDQAVVRGSHMASELAQMHEDFSSPLPTIGLVQCLRGAISSHS